MEFVPWWTSFRRHMHLLYLLSDCVVQLHRVSWTMALTPGTGSLCVHQASLMARGELRNCSGPCGSGMLRVQREMWRGRDRRGLFFRAGRGGGWREYDDNFSCLLGKRRWGTEREREKDKRSTINLPVCVSNRTLVCACECEEVS